MFACRANVARNGVILLVTALLVAACGVDGGDSNAVDSNVLDSDQYLDRVHGSWLAAMVANHSGLPIEGIWIDEPGPGEEIELILLDEGSTDDDTHIEWLDLHILETHGLNPSYEQVRDEWVEHLEGDIWVSTRVARDLMDEGVVPPETSDPALNPDGVWSIDAQLQTELFGLLAPGRPQVAREQAEFFALVSNRGPAVDASAFYAHVISEAFFDDDVESLLTSARASEPDDSIVAPIFDDVLGWYQDNPDDWRATRELIRATYDVDPEFWGSRVNYASTIMALPYGDGDLRSTLDIAGLSGWGNDNNMTTAANILGVIIGFDDLPEPFASATDVYFNQDLVGGLPQFDSVENIAIRTVALGEQLTADR